MQGDTHTERVSEGRVCVRAVHGSLSLKLTLTRPPPQQQPHTQQEKAKEGRWRGRPRCCRHCRQPSPCHLLWRLWLVLFPSDWLLYFHFCFSSRVPVPSAAGSLFGMPSSVLLSASLLAKLPFPEGDGGVVSAWPSEGSFCELAVMGATPSVCELLFDFMSLWGSCSCYTGAVSSGLDCPFTRACVESPSVFPIVFIATSAVAFVGDGDVACGIVFSFAAFSSVPVGELSFLFFCVLPLLLVLPVVVVFRFTFILFNLFQCSHPPFRNVWWNISVTVIRRRAIGGCIALGRIIQIVIFARLSDSTARWRLTSALALGLRCLTACGIPGIANSIWINRFLTASPFHRGLIL
ncbi:hypothetical protein TCDM_13690 [Trypanosoma cruzi Dm28c]|uniref:Uncharacterized protein n=1 Tax=Trypanosoma cruzi Dm28c TaxID=1416333 RepID=V5AI09_TRYCR|nr:hypothetical protein TCDM_13690 [Trypanosoma cruzi Dm28c]